MDTARDVMRVEEKMDELYNNGDISGKTHDEVLNHLSEVEEALYERIKDNMENNFYLKLKLKMQSMQMVSLDINEHFTIKMMCTRMSLKMYWKLMTYRKMQMKWNYS